MIRVIKIRGLELVFALAHLLGRASAGGQIIHTHNTYSGWTSHPELPDDEVSGEELGFPTTIDLRRRS